MIINGLLSVDVSYTFGYSVGGQNNKLYMGEGAGIEIQDGQLLTAKRTHISGCSGMWDRIKVLSKGAFYISNNSKISDAVVGIEQQDESSVRIHKTRFLNNDIGIGSFGVEQKQIELIFYLTQSGATEFKDCKEGAHFENVDLIALQGLITFPNSPPIPYEGGGAILFRDIETNGVYLENTDLIGKSLYFNNCQTGIRVATANNLLSIEHSTFENGSTGIYTRGSLEMEVVDCEFSSLKNGILRGSAIMGEHTLIENNHMSLSGINILAITMPSRAEIMNNSMEALGNNVTLWGYGEGKHKWAIQHNEQLITGVGSYYGEEVEDNENALNISFVNTNNARIFKNDAIYSAGRNVHISGGRDNIFGYNEYCIADVKSTYLAGSPKAQIYCNGIDAPKGLQVINDCTGSDIRGNSFSGAWNDDGRNIIYGSEENTYAVSSEQKNKGNTFDLSDAAHPKAIHYGSAEVALMSQYFVGGLSAMQGDVYHPYFESDFDNWFFKEGTTDYVCAPGIIDGDPTDKVRQAKDTYLSLQDINVGNIYGEEVAFDVDMKLYKDLRLLETYEPLNQEDALKKEELATKDAGDFSFLQDELSALTSLTEVEEAQMTALTEDIENLTSQIGEVVWYTIDESDFEGVIEIDEAQKQIRDDLIIELRQKVTMLKTFAQDKQSTLLSEIPTLRNYNESITGISTNSGQNFQKVNGYMYKRLEAGVGEFSKEEIADLTDIANQCAGTGGQAVYTARAILAEITFTVPEYDDECLTGRKSKIKKMESHAGTKEITVVPNPASNRITIFLPADHTMEELHIMDVLGKTLSIIPLEEGQQNVDVNITTFEQGIYWIVTPHSDFAPEKLIISQ